MPNSLWRMKINSYLLLKGNKSHFIEYKNNYLKCTDNTVVSLGESDSLWAQLYAKKDSITTSDHTKMKMELLFTTIA